MKQQIFEGLGGVNNLPHYLERMKSQRVMLFHGRSSYASSGVAEVVTALQNSTPLPPGNRVHKNTLHPSSISSFTWSFYSDIPPNPEIESIRNAFKEFQKFKPDTVIAVGGGSVIDTAKAVLAYAGSKSEEELFTNRFQIVKHYQGPNKDHPAPAQTGSLHLRAPHFLVVPTTAGSGSESTHFAVVYKEGKKYSLAKEGLQPDVVILDPLATISCPPPVTLASGVDAVCQSIESYWNTFAAGCSQKYSLDALNLLLPSLFTVLEQPADIIARQHMLKGANLAGRAINITKTTAGHAMSYGLTSLLGLPHGLAVLSVMQPLVRRMDQKYHFFSTYDSAPSVKSAQPHPTSPVESVQRTQAFQLYQDFIKLLPAKQKNKGPSGTGQSEKKAEITFSEAFDDFCEQMWAINSLQAYFRSIKPADIEETVEQLAGGVNIERLENHPVALTVDDIKQVYGQVFYRHT